MRRTSAVLGSVFFLFLAPGTVAVLVPWLISDWTVRPAFFGLPAIRVLGWLLLAAGIPALLDSFARFAWQGLGTPAPVLPTKHLVVTGFYRYVRNPMYVGVLAVIFGQGLILSNVRVLAYGAAAWAAFFLFVLGYEEPTLRRAFGEEYRTFCANVPRWIPRISPWTGLLR